MDFSVDINPLGPPASVRATIIKHVDDIQRYPDPQASALRAAIARHHRIPAACVLPGNGTAELIAWLPHLRPLRKALVFAPTFIEYEWAAAHVNAEVDYMMAEESLQFQWEMSGIDWPERLRGVDLVVLCNPNNPTGAVVPRDQVLELAVACDHAGSLLVVDEAFVDFIEDPARVSVAPFIERFEHLMVLRSLTKLFAIPGLRLGYLLASAQVVDRLRAIQSAWPLNSFALAVGPTLFEEGEYVRHARAYLAEARVMLQRLLCEIPGIHPYPSAANFLLCRLARVLTSSELCQRMAQRGIVLRNGDSFTGLEPGRFIRLGVRAQEDNARLASVLREVFTHAG